MTIAAVDAVLASTHVHAGGEAAGAARGDPG